jgi:hypothetical protein
VEKQENTELATGALSHLSVELDNLRGKLKVLEMEMSELKKQIIEKKLATVKIKYGLFIGCIVKNKKGELFTVSKIDTRYDHKPSIEGHKQKKNGGFAINTQYIYEWVVVV